jgi:multisubunit Na+/H+ antiporter MnhF subunit
MEVGLLVEEYGMAVLGLVMFIVLWKVVFGPSFALFVKGIDALKIITESQKVISINQSEMEKTQKASLIILNGIVTRIESLEKKYAEREERDVGRTADERASARRAG